MNSSLVRHGAARRGVCRRGSLLSWAAPFLGAMLLLLLSDAASAEPGAASTLDDAPIVSDPVVNSVVPPDGGGGVPSCGTISLQSKQVTRLPQESGGLISGYSFKVVAVDLAPWLGRNGTGTMDVYVDDQFGVDSYEGYTASTQSGARTGILFGSWNPVNPKGTIDVYAFIEKNGNAKCGEKFRLYYPGGGPA